MRRWNGWGDDANDMHLSLDAQAFLSQALGPGLPLQDVTLESVLAKVPVSRLPEHALICRDAEVRVRHARGQSLPDWLAMHSGEIGVFPDGVAFPESPEQIRALLQLAEQQDWLVIPYGGGTSVAGHINPQNSDKPVLTLSLENMTRLLLLDTTSQIATFEPGANGPQVEEQLAARGYVLGHFPQSFELSTVGGWVASRSSGQQSLRYGRIEQLFAGGRMETAQGTLTMPTFPASSAGPDLREIVMGSEGRMGVISEVKVRVTPLPEKECFDVAFLPSWQVGIACVRAAVQGKLPLSMVRLSNAEETHTQLIIAAGQRVSGWLGKLLSLRGISDGKVMLTFGSTGSKAQVAFARREMRALVSAHEGVFTGAYLGRKWQHNRFRSPYLRHGLWSHGYAVDTLETASDWIHVPGMVAAVEQALRQAIADEGEKVHVFTHLSHVYAQGSSSYTTYVFRCADNYEKTLARWRRLKQAASDAIVAHHGTISHQHGVGRDHAPWLHHEKGAEGMRVLKALVQHFDPAQRLNPGCLLPDNETEQ